MNQNNSPSSCPRGLIPPDTCAAAGTCGGRERGPQGVFRRASRKARSAAGRETPKIAALFLFASLAAFAPGCSGKKETAPVSNVTVKTPYQELDTTVMISYNGSRKVWILESRHIVKSLADTGHIVGDPVTITVFDSLGRKTSKVLSDSGIADASLKSFTVWGNVFVLAENGTRVKAQKLFWNQKTHRVTSDTHVQLTTKKGDVLRGKGLDAAEDFSSWEFKQDVSGRFPNFKERVEKGEEFN